MSSIDRLLIRGILVVIVCLDHVVSGIRSFGPSERDQVIVKFDKPVTLIVGQNGAGKTVYLPRNWTLWRNVIIS